MLFQLVEETQGGKSRGGPVSQELAHLNQNQISGDGLGRVLKLNQRVNMFIGILA